ncbi:MAG: hypothetical protein QOD72_2310 [Acidimicrobiaceae bacterium]|jgi:hypothetical protein|nr:hypothetical protein [Acidimicrobiaceae bacterium]
MSDHTEDPDVDGPPTRRPKALQRPWGLIVIGASLLVALLVAALISSHALGFWTSSSSSQPLARQFKDLNLDRSFQLVAEQSSGDSGCFMGVCRILDHYYVSELAADAACVDVARALAAWATIHPDPAAMVNGSGKTCAFRGVKDSFGVVAEVRQDIPDYAQSLIGEQPITERYHSVLIIELSEH